MNCHCWAITCTCSGVPPLGFKIGVFPWPLPAPGRHREFHPAEHGQAQHDHGRHPDPDGRDPGIAVRVQLRGDPRHEVLRAGELSLDVGRMQANVGNGPIPLTRLEFLLLRELMEHAGHSVPKDQLLASIWGYNFDPGPNVVDVCVRRLRSKLGFELIRTVRGAGYQLAA